MNFLQDMLFPAHPTPAQLIHTSPFPVLPQPGPEHNGLGDCVPVLKGIGDKYLGYTGGV